MSYGLRSAENVTYPFSRTKILQESFIPATVKDWNNMPEDSKCLKSYEAFCDSFPDKEKVPKYYYAGSRKGPILHARLRMECSALRSHLYNKNILNSPTCACGDAAETNTHYLLECEDYSIQRDKLFESIDFMNNLDCETLLRGSDAITDEQNKNIFISAQMFYYQVRSI